MTSNLSICMTRSRQLAFSSEINVMKIACQRKFGDKRMLLHHENFFVWHFPVRKYQEKFNKHIFSKNVIEMTKGEHEKTFQE